MTDYKSTTFLSVGLRAIGYDLNDYDHTMLGDAANRLEELEIILADSNLFLKEAGKRNSTLFIELAKLKVEKK